MAKTTSYILGIEGQEINVGDLVYLGEIVSGEEDMNEILESESVYLDGNVIDFVIDERDEEDILKTMVVVVDIY